MKHFFQSWLHYGMMVFLILSLTNCGGGGSSGGGGTIASIPKAQAAQQGVWVLRLPQFVFAEPLLSMAMSTNINTFYNNYPSNSGTKCPSGGSLNTSSAVNKISFTASNCLQSGGATANGSATLVWSTVNYVTCGSLQIPSNLTNTYTLNNFIITAQNPTASITGNGAITVNESTYSCTNSAPTITMNLTISPPTSLTSSFNLTSPTATFAFDATITSMSENVILTYDSTGSLTNATNTVSATYTSPGLPGTYSITTNTPFQSNLQVSSIPSSGSMTITNTSGETVTVTANSTTQVTVVTTTNGSSQTTTETWGALLGS